MGEFVKQTTNDLESAIKAGFNNIGESFEKSTKSIGERRARDFMVYAESPKANTAHAHEEMKHQMLEEHYKEASHAMSEMGEHTRKASEMIGERRARDLNVMSKEPSTGATATAEHTDDPAAVQPSDSVIAAHYSAMAHAFQKMGSQMSAAQHRLGERRAETFGKYADPTTEWHKEERVEDSNVDHLVDAHFEKMGTAMKELGDKFHKAAESMGLDGGDQAADRIAEARARDLNVGKSGEAGETNNTLATAFHSVASTFRRAGQSIGESRARDWNVVDWGGRPEDAEVLHKQYEEVTKSIADLNDHVDKVLAKDSAKPTDAAK